MTETRFPPTLRACYTFASDPEGLATAEALAREHAHSEGHPAPERIVWVDDDLGEVRVMRSYSEWGGVPAQTRGAMHATGRDTEAVLREVMARN